MLGAAESDFFSSSTSQKGYAVTMASNKVSLARFSKGWTSGTQTTLLPKKATTNALTGAVTWTVDEGKTPSWTNGIAGKTLAVRVDWIPAVEGTEGEDGVKAVPAQLLLYVKEVEGTGGNPLAECGSGDLAVTVHLTGDDVVPDALPHAGAVWNHGYDTTSASAKKWGLFDDLYFPCQKNQEMPAAVRVIDEDAEAPAFDEFTIGGALAQADAAAGGLCFTGRVHDASGIWTSGEKEPTWTLFINGVQKGEPGTFSTITPSENGAGTDVELVATIPADRFAEAPLTTNCVVVVSAWDHDRDRDGDSLEGTESYRFTL